MKKQSKLEVLLAVVLAFVTLFMGVAFATSIELNSDYSDFETALSLLRVMTLADESVTLNLSNGDIKITSAGFTAHADDGRVIEGTSNNITVITSSATSNSITLSGSNVNCNLTLNNVKTSSNMGVKFENTNSTCNVTILLAGDNSIGQLYYWGDAKLKITSASGDGSTNGKLTVSASGWSAAIGGQDNPTSEEYFSDLTIAGGTIVATAADGAAIGGAGNGSAMITITGGHVTATNSGNSATIGGGGGHTGSGGAGTVIIKGGTVVAKNDGNGVAIGGGSTDAPDQSVGVANIQLLDGNVTAIAANNYGYSGGRIIGSNTYGATNVTIGNDVVYSGTINTNATIVREALIFDLAKGDVVFTGNNYSGVDMAGNPINGTHNTSNRYIVRQSNSGTATANTIRLNNAISGTVHLEIDGINSKALNSIDIPAASGSVKDVVLYLRGENRINNLRYFTSTEATSKKEDQSNSKLKITSADGDGSTTGSLLVYPPSLSEPVTGIYYNAGIGGTDDDAGVAGLTIAGGTIKVKVDATHDCSAIGGGGNGYAQITITGGYIEAENASTGATIGGGVGYTAPGSGCDILITGGTVKAKNNGKLKGDYGVTANVWVYGVAIGGGSSYEQTALSDDANVTITGGNVTAEVKHGQTAIGAGNSCKSNAGNATVNISDGTINCTGGIGGGSSVHANGGDCTVIISGGDITVDNQAGACIGGGTGKTSGGDAIVNISAGTLKTGSIGGGLATGENAPIGTANVTISGGQIQGQVVMAAGANTPCSFLMTGGTIDNANSSEFYYIRDVGGAAYVENGTATMKGGTIRNCGAEHQASDKNGSFDYGGAFYVTGGNFIMSGGTLESNTAAKDGGAVYVTSGTVEVGTKDCTAEKHPLLQNNRAENGGAVAVAGATKIPVMYCGEMKNNVAEQNGGAMYVTGSGFNMVYGTLVENEADNGGGVYVSGGNFEMSNGSINYNTASINGGAVYMSGGNYTMYHGAVNNNSAVDGGAVYMGGTAANFKMQSGTMNYNTASHDGGAVFAKGGKLEIGLVDCKDETASTDCEAGGADDHHPGEKHHPEIQHNEAKNAGGAISIDKPAEGQTPGVVHFYCGVATQNKALYKGVGNNVFMQGGEFYLYDATNIGQPRDPDLVIIGGELHNECANKEYVKLLYYMNNTDKDEGNVYQGLAEKNEYINMPEGEYFWDAPEGYRFFGWTGKGYDSTEKNVRNKGQYVQSGNPIEIIDEPMNTLGETQIIYDGDNADVDEEGQDVMHLYALWAPETSNITYVKRIVDRYETGTPIEGSGPATYKFSETEYDLDINTLTEPGYIIAGWYIYQNEGQNANWGYEPNPTGIGTDYSKLTYEGMQYFKLDNLGADLSLTVPGLTFGDITLIADFVPAYTDLIITKSGAQTMDGPQSFIFHVTGTPSNTVLKKVDMTVVINLDGQTSGSVTLADLPVGSYQVKEITDWSWRYAPKDGDTRSVTLEKPENPQTVSFANNREKTLWLDGSNYKTNNFS